MDKRFHLPTELDALAQRLDQMRERVDALQDQIDESEGAPVAAGREAQELKEDAAELRRLTNRVVIAIEREQAPGRVE